MASLELLVDAAGVGTGAQVARTGLDSIIAKGMQAADAMDQVGSVSTVTGASMQQAFGAAKGGLQVTAGLQGVIAGLGGAIAGTRDFSSALQGMGRTLLEVGRAKDEWRNLSTAMVATSTVSKVVERDMLGVAIGVRDVVTTTRTAQSGFGALWMALKANPIASVAAVLGTIATAMTFLGGETKKARQEFESLATAMNKARMSDASAAVFGQAAPRGEMAQIQQAYASLRAGGGNVTYRQAAEALGQSPLDITRFFANNGDAAAQAYLQTGRYPGWNDRGRASYLPQPGQFTMNQDQLAQLFRGAYTSADRRANSQGFFTNTLQWWRPPAEEQPAAGGGGGDGMGPYLPGTTGDAMARAGAIQWHDEQARRQREEEDAQNLERMREIASLSQQIGGYLGDAATRFLTGMASARDLLQQVLADMMRAGLTAGFTGITKGFLEGFGFGTTPTQAKADT